MKFMQSANNLRNMVTIMGKGAPEVKYGVEGVKFKSLAIVEILFTFPQQYYSHIMNCQIELIMF